MRAVVASVNAVITIAPVAFIAIVALPIACICKRLAHVTEHTNLHSLFGVVLAHEHMWWCCGFCERRRWPAIPMPNQDMRMLVIRWIASFRCFSFVTWPRGPAKAEPVLTPLAEAVAADANVVLAIITSSAVVVKLVLYVILPAALTRYVWLGIDYRRTQCCHGSLPWPRFMHVWVGGRARKCRRGCQRRGAAMRGSWQPSSDRIGGTS
jgi:hypothetical protein